MHTSHITIEQVSYLLHLYQNNGNALVVAAALKNIVHLYRPGRLSDENDVAKMLGVLLRLDAKSFGLRSEFQALLESVKQGIGFMPAYWRLNKLMKAGYVLLGQGNELSLPVPGSPSRWQHRLVYVDRSPFFARNNVLGTDAIRAACEAANIHYTVDPSMMLTDSEARHTPEKEYVWCQVSGPAKDSPPSLPMARQLKRDERGMTALEAIFAYIQYPEMFPSVTFCQGTYPTVWLRRGRDGMMLGTAESLLIEDCETVVYDNNFGEALRS